jgi:two-component system phosphate regulon sensor histidine kinase PhoR
VSLFARLGIGARLALASVLLLLAAGFFIERLSSAELEAAMLERVRGDLAAELGLLEDEALRAGAAGARDRAAWDAEADRLGARSGARITLIAPDGTVVGDSDVALGELGALENHAAREEVARARETGQGTAVRASPTLGPRMIYAARRYPEPSHGVGVVRIAVPLAGVDAALAGSRRLLALGTAVAIAVAVALGVLGTLRLTRPVRELTATALAMAGGRLDARAPADGDDEVARLARAVNHMAGELSASMKALRSERDLLAGILDGMREGVLVLADDERVVLANRALRAMTLAGEGVVGKPLLEAVRSAGLRDAVERVRRDNEATSAEIELGGLLPRRLLVRVSPLYADGGRDAICVFHDVTDLRRLETIRTDFVANVSHELRTPVTAIVTASETLLGGALDHREDAAEFVGVIDRHGRRLRQLVDDLLELSKIEAKAFRLVTATFDVGPVVEHTAGLFEDAARRRRVTLDVAVDRDARAHADRRALEHVLSNLIDNAIKYAGEGAHVTLSAEAKDGEVAIVVADDGPGIPAAHLGRIFERFYRVDAGRSRELGGTGLGLSIVKHLLEQMGGSVAVESEAGRGARFTVRVPGGGRAGA